MLTNLLANALVAGSLALAPAMAAGNHAPPLVAETTTLTGGKAWEWRLST
jgi:hypothetical protein